ncbi:hypothetical protein TRFO_15474 [Tritrichomonas foetus]|uniref:Uncharacterized protein n=1 Tax=Tritrichomonas foetus TaxID=1144522 RepID=A0A1J4KWV9_9EUKA|nr:hypothetical protein TRFO_15474 [Tritrichomonas foetus]|eukprot:OHT14190.1 hypothetical protein TRFO_15474 [Tritrichomonas foetus]
MNWGSTPEEEILSLSVHDSSDLISIIKDDRILAYLKDPNYNFMAFFRTHAAELVNNVLYRDPEISPIYYSHAMQILTSQNPEIRNAMTEDDEILNTILEFPKYTETSTPVIRGCYCKILEQIILLSEVDYLSRIEDGKSFLNDLLNISNYLSVFDFLTNFVSSHIYSIIVFFENNKFTELLLDVVFNSEKCQEQTIKLIDYLTHQLPRTSSLVSPLQNPETLLKLLDLGLINGSYVAIDLVLSIHNQPHPLSRAAIDAVNLESTRICQFIRSTRVFSRTAISAIYLLMSIVNDTYCIEEPVSNVEPIKVDFSTKRIGKLSDSVDLFHFGSMKKPNTTTSNQNPDDNKVKNEERLSLSDFNRPRHSADAISHFDMFDDTPNSNSNKNHDLQEDHQKSPNKFINQAKSHIFVSKGKKIVMKKRKLKVSRSSDSVLLGIATVSEDDNESGSHSISKNHIFSSTCPKGSSFLSEHRDKSKHVQIIDSFSLNDQVKQNMSKKNPSLLSIDEIEEDDENFNVLNGNVSTFDINEEHEKNNKEDENEPFTMHEEQEIEEEEVNDEKLDVIEKETNEIENKLRAIDEKTESNSYQLETIGEDAENESNLGTIQEEPEASTKYHGSIEEKFDIGLVSIQEELEETNLDVIEEEPEEEDRHETIEEEEISNGLDVIAEEQGEPTKTLETFCKEAEENDNFETIQEESEKMNFDAIKEEPEKETRHESIGEEVENGSNFGTIHEEQEEIENNLGAIDEEPENELVIIQEEQEEDDQEDESPDNTEKNAEFEHDRITLENLAEDNQESTDSNFLLSIPEVSEFEFTENQENSISTVTESPEENSPNDYQFSSIVETDENTNNDFEAPTKPYNNNNFGAISEECEADSSVSASVDSDETYYKSTTLPKGNKNSKHRTKSYSGVDKTNFFGLNKSRSCELSEDEAKVTRIIPHIPSSIASLQSKSTNEHFPFLLPNTDRSPDSTPTSFRKKINPTASDPNIHNSLNNEFNNIPQISPIATRQMSLPDVSCISQPNDNFLPLKKPVSSLHPSFSSNNLNLTLNSARTPSSSHFIPQSIPFPSKSDKTSPSISPLPKPETRILSAPLQSEFQSPVGEKKVSIFKTMLNQPRRNSSLVLRQTDGKPPLPEYTPRPIPINNAKTKTATPDVGHNIFSNLPSPISTNPDTGEQLSLLEFAKQEPSPLISGHTSNATLQNLHRRDSYSQLEIISDEDDEMFGKMMLPRHISAPTLSPPSSPPYGMSFSKSPPVQTISHSRCRTYGNCEMSGLLAIEEVDETTSEPASDDHEFIENHNHNKNSHNMSGNNSNSYGCLGIGHNVHCNSHTFFDTNDLGNLNDIKEEADDDEEEIADDFDKGKGNINCEEIIETAVFLINAFFEHKTNSFLHNAVIEFLTSIFDFTTMTGEIIEKSHLPNRILEIPPTEPATYWGQLHNMVEFIRCCPEQIPSEIAVEWQNYINNVYETEEEIMTKSYGGNFPELSQIFSQQNGDRVLLSDL